MKIGSLLIPLSTAFNLDPIEQLAHSVPAVILVAI
ncbi:hypothetical protein EST38_g5831 [Candolleomyces aberdarensis]|uniref:Uncharacterized protein n=1 Tax=Candolleomyces aberdarensis TaxID=2316362 RepID=A0A4Q2DJD7_9AGAR|nr:hypothetical protein EST38_g5831 [Candolleomyces aberdarensis]